MARPPRNKDPFAAREAERYDQPIPSREFILAHLAETSVPADYQTLCRELGLTTEQACEALRKRLNAMCRDGQLISNRRGLYGLVDRMELIKGSIQGNRDGSGYFIPTDGSDDLYLPPTEMQKVFDGDIVLVRMVGFGSRGRREGMIVEILQRHSEQLVGRYYSDLGIGVLIPANRRICHEIIIPDKHNHGARDGQYVVGEITTYPSPRHKPVARIVEILGDTATPGLEIEIAVRSHDIPNQWPAAVSKQANRIEDVILDDDLRHRQDLRHLPFVTIDGEDAKDFDDAVYAESDGDGWRLFVAIADVSHYVEVGTALDEEARSRGNSVYFPGHVIPMLPEALSNGVCSLRPEEDRLVMVCELTIDSEGDVNNYRFFEGVIHSHARLTYTEVADLLEPADEEIRQRLQQRMIKRHESLVGHLQTLHGLYGQLRKARERGGALDFDTTETRIVFGEGRRIREIIPVERTCAHRLIEECMLRANVAAAKLLRASGLPVLFRVHDGPGLEKLRKYLAVIGLRLGGGEKPRPIEYQNLLKEVATRPDAHLIHTMVIRSMMQAVYQAENIGHFGLGYEVYTHFTSPIRRYPDLLVHRAIRFLLGGQKTNRHLLKKHGTSPIPRARIYPYNPNEMQLLGENCSMTERRADAASYDVIDWLKCEYMQDRVGDQFEGTIAAVTGFGLFVELEGIYIEGLVHITALDNDYYHFDAASQVLIGERTGKRYHLGDPVRVQVAAVSLDERKIDLAMVGSGGQVTSRKKTGRATRRTAGKAATNRKTARTAEKPAGRRGRKAKSADGGKGRKTGRQRQAQTDRASAPGGSGKKAAEKKTGGGGRANSRKRR